ncbi:acyloxyacyl hydrolase [Crotalus adamanteus]|uniref:Acyloxyacyl hydrolase n=1 Tax=Crotalus adamanteus TaxID=8729 RepID=A0AAW1B506_CROAD
MLLTNGSSFSHDELKLFRSKHYHRFSCIGCVSVVAIIQQLSQVHNSTVKATLERFCTYLPETFHLQGICFLLVEIYGPKIIKLVETKMNADVICHSIHACIKKAGQPYCHLYPPPKERFNIAIKKLEGMFTTRSQKYVHELSFICTLPFMRNLCRRIEFFVKNQLPFVDLDGDKFSTYQNLRGYYWRGQDCNDRNAAVYPGRRPEDWDAKEDSNCNGISGVDSKDGIPYEQKFCNGTESKGIIMLGDSAGARAHIPPEWITASQISPKTYSNILEVISNEIDWPQFSAVTGFLNSTIGGRTESLYSLLRRRNRCNHKDYQNISKNGASSRNVLHLVQSLARNQQFDKPAIVIFAMIGNDVCNGNPDTLNKMTHPKQMRSNVVKTLLYLDSQLPKGSHVILIGLVNGSFIWDAMHRRYHPLGQLNKDVTYEQFYSFLSCLQINPCNGWLTSNGILRNLTTERAMLLSNVLKEIAKSEKYLNFDVFYMDFPLKEIIVMWQKMKGETWQLLEPMDGFHPNQFASAFEARILWKKLLQERPDILGKENPFNSEIAAIFHSQGH